MDTVLVPALLNSSRRRPGKGHRIAAEKPAQVSKAMTDKSGQASHIGGGKSYSGLRDLLDSTRTKEEH
jgi:hypothetical protein